MSHNAASGEAVLFVDPDRASAQALASAISDHYATALVATARDASRVFASRLPTVLVVELRLPDINGLDLVARVRQSPQTRNVLIMIVTARSSVQDRIAGFQAGADDYLIKPVEPRDFVAHLRTVIRFRQTVGAPLSLIDTTWGS